MTVIRPAQPEDAPLFAQIEARAAAFPWSESLYLASAASHHCWTLEIDGVVSGCLIFRRVLDEVELLNLVVDPQLQGRGLGARLVQFLIDTNSGQASRIFLEVRAENASARHLYEKCGFAAQGRRKDYYPAANNGREDALLMEYRYD